MEKKMHAPNIAPKAARFWLSRRQASKKTHLQQDLASTYSDMLKVEFICIVKPDVGNERKIVLYDPKNRLESEFHRGGTK